MGRMLARFVVLALATALVANACGGEFLTPTSPGEVGVGVTIGGRPPVPAPVPAPTPTGPVMASPPAGVSSGVWRVAFSSDGRMRRPDAVHIVLPSDTDEVTKTLFASVVGKVIGFIEGKTPMDLVASPFSIGNFPVTVVPSLLCGGEAASACNTLNYNSVGKVVGGKIEFATTEYMHDEVIVMHEIFRTLGLTGLSPVPGIMSPTWVWGQPRPSDEEQKMLLARYDYPLLSVYAPQ